MAKIALGSLKGPKGDAGDVTPEALAAKSAAEAARAAAVSAKNGAESILATVDQKVASVPTPEVLASTYASLSQIPRNVISFGAVGGGVVDDTNALKSALAWVGAVEGRTLAFPDNWTFRFTAPLSIFGKSNFRILFNGSTLRFDGSTVASGGSVRLFDLNTCTDAYTSGPTVDVVTQDQQYTAIAVSGASARVTMEDAVAYNARWVGVSIGDSTTDVHLIRPKGIGCRFGIYSKGAGAIVENATATSRWSETQEFQDKGGVWDTTSVYWDGIIIGGVGWHLINPVTNDNGQSGIYAGGATSNGEISNPIAIGNWNKGIDLGATGAKSDSNRIHGINITGGHVLNNKTGNVHGRHWEYCSVVGTVSSLTGDLNTAGIVLNGDSVGNTIANTQVTVAHPTAAAIFIENTAGSTGNNVIFNMVTAAVPYSLNTAKNTLISLKAGLKFQTAVKSRIEVDLSAETGFAGREVLRFTSAPEATYNQITSEKSVRIVNVAGAPMDFSVGALTANTGLTLGGGTAFFADATFLRLPRTTSTGAGHVWYDATAGTLKYRDGVAGVTRTVSAV